MGKAIGYAILIWIVGFVWGSIVFMTPGLKRVPAIPYVSSNPAISFPILAIWPVLVWLLAQSYIKTMADKTREGLKLGLIFALVNFVLDLIVLVVLLRAGFGYFISLTVWLAYLMLLLLPWLVGRRASDP